MADLETAADIDRNTDQGQMLWGPYFSGPDTCVDVWHDDGDDIVYNRSTNATDASPSWAKTEITAGTARQIACFYDKQIPGNAGTLIHIVWMDEVDGSVYYRTLDVATDTLGTQRTVASGITVAAQIYFSRCCIAVAVNGNIGIGYETQDEIDFLISDDSGATWTSQTSNPYESDGQEDWALGFPADVDAGDMAFLFWDRSANEISVKMYDESADSISETSILTSMADTTSFIQMAAQVLHSDKKVYGVAHTIFDDSTDDLVSFVVTPDSISSPTIVTSTAAIFTNQAESVQCAMAINQQNDDVYVFYLKGGTYGSSMDVVYHKSTDKMVSWGSEQAYSEQTADNFKNLSASASVDDDGGQIMASFYEEGAGKLFVNHPNSIDIAAAAGVTVAEMVAASTPHYYPGPMAPATMVPF